MLKTNLKRAMSWTLALAMAMFVLPAMTPLAKAALKPEISSVDLSNPVDKLSAEGWKWDGSILTIDGLNLATATSPAIDLPANATIVVNGVNSIAGTGGMGMRIQNGKLTIEGTGTLDVTAGGGINNFGIRADADTVTGIEITGDVKANITAENTTNTAFGIRMNGTLTISGNAEVKLEAKTALNSVGVSSTGQVPDFSPVGLSVTGGLIRLIGGSRAGIINPLNISTGFSAKGFASGSSDDYSTALDATLVGNEFKNSGTNLTNVKIANFSGGTAPTHAVNFSVIGGNGTLTATVDGNAISTGDEVDEGKTVVFTATPNSAFKVKEWKDNNSTVNGTNTTYTLTGLTAPHTVTVAFEDNSGHGGDITGPEEDLPNLYANFTFKFGAIGHAPVEFTDKSERKGEGTWAPTSGDYNNPQGWINTPGVKNVKLMVDPDNPDNNIAEIDKVSTDPAEPLGMIKNFPDNDIVRSGMVSVASRVKVDGSATRREIVLGQNATTPIATVAFENGQILGHDSSVLLASTAADTWYDVEIIADLDAKTYAVKIDGGAETPFGFQNATATSFGRMAFRIPGSATPGKFYVDNVAIKTNAKVNIQTAAGSNLSEPQVGRVAPATYWISLPEGYYDPINAGKTWPVIMHTVRWGNEQNFFETIRQRDLLELPFIIVGVDLLGSGFLAWGYPLPSNGNLARPDGRSQEVMDYMRDLVEPGQNGWGTPNRWSTQLSEQLLLETFMQIKADYNTEDKFYLSGGYSAAGADIWPFMAYYPEYLASVTASSPSSAFTGRFNGRLYFDGTNNIENLGSGMYRFPFSDHPSRVDLPVRIFLGLASGNGPAIDINDTYDIHDQSSDNVYNMNRNDYRMAVRTWMAFEQAGFRNFEISTDALTWHHETKYVAEELKFIKSVYEESGDYRPLYNGPELPAPTLSAGMEGRILISNFDSAYKANTYIYGPLQYSLDNGINWKFYYISGIPGITTSTPLLVRYSGNFNYTPSDYEPENIPYQYANFTFNLGAPGLPPIDFPERIEGSILNGDPPPYGYVSERRAGGTIAVVPSATNRYTVPGHNGEPDMTGSIDNQYVVMDKTSTDPAKGVEMVRDFIANDQIKQGKVSVKSTVRVNDSVSVREISLYADKTIPIAGVLIGNGKITALDGTALMPSVPLDIWLTIEIILNLETKTYDVVIDKKKAGRGIDWSNKGTAPISFGRLVYKIRGSSTAGQFHIDSILIKASEKINVQTNKGTALSPMQQGRTVPSAYQVILPPNYNPDRAKPYPIIMHSVNHLNANNKATDLAQLRDTVSGMPEFVIIAIHTTGSGYMGAYDQGYTVGYNFPYNAMGWYSREIMSYKWASTRPGERVPWSGAPVSKETQPGGSSFDEQVVIETFLQIKEDYNVEGKFFWDGYGGAGYSLFPVLMHHPEYISAVFSSDTNYTGTGEVGDAWTLGTGQIRPVSDRPDRVNLPIRLATAGGYSASDNDMNLTDRIHNRYIDQKDGIPLPIDEQQSYARTKGRQNLRAKLTMEGHGFNNVEMYWLPLNASSTHYSAETMAFFKQVYNNEADPRKAYNGTIIPAPQLNQQGVKLMLTNFDDDYRANTYQYGPLQYSFDGTHYTEYLVDGVELPTEAVSVYVRYGGIGGVVNAADIALAYKASPPSAGTEFTLKPIQPEIKAPAAGALTAGKVSVTYRQAITAIGGSLAWDISAGALPGGLTINPVTGVISGMPTTAGNFTFTVRATNIEGNATRQYSIYVEEDSNMYHPGPTVMEVTLRDLYTSNPSYFSGDWHLGVPENKEIQDGRYVITSWNNIVNVISAQAGAKIEFPFNGYGIEVRSYAHDISFYAHDYTVGINGGSLSAPLTSRVAYTNNVNWRPYCPNGNWPPLTNNTAILFSTLKKAESDDRFELKGGEYILSLTNTGDNWFTADSTISLVGFIIYKSYAPTTPTISDSTLTITNEADLRDEYEDKTREGNTTDLLYQVKAASAGSWGTEWKTYNPANGIDVSTLMPGNYVIHVKFAERANWYESGVSETSGAFTITNIPQTTPVTVNAVTGKKYGDAPIQLSAVGGDGAGAFSFAVVSGPGAVSGDMLTINGAGDIKVTATKAGDDKYNALTSAPLTINIGKGNPPAGVDQTANPARNNPTNFPFTLTTLLPNVPGLEGVTYSPVITANTDGVLGVLNYTSGNTLMLPVLDVDLGKTAEITVTISSNNYEDFTSTITITTIDKITVTITGLTTQNGTYNSNIHTGYTGTPGFTNGSPTVKTLTASYTGRNGTSYTSTTPPTNAGDYTVKLSLDNDPAYIGSVSLDFTIAKGNPSYTLPTGLSAAYGGKLADVNLPTGFTWNDPTASVGNATPTGWQFAAIFTPADTDNYNTLTNVQITVVVNKAAGTFGTPGTKTAAYSATLKLSDVAPGTGYAWVAPATVLQAGDGQSFAATYIDPSGNYTVATGNITVNVAKASKPADVTASTQKFIQSKEDTRTVDLAALRPIIAGDYGATTYTAAVTDTKGILSAPDNGTVATPAAMAITVKDSATATETATIVVTVTSKNYAVFTITIAVEIINKSTLSAAITDAAANLDTAVVSADGSDIAVTQDWVTQAVKTAYQNAIETARVTLNDTNATQLSVDTAVTDLEIATTAFNDAKAKGTKGILITSIETGNGQANVNFAIKSANGKGYSVYISETGKEGPFKPHSNVNYNAKGAHIKGLTNGEIYYAYIEYRDAKGNITTSDVVMLKPSK